MDKLYYDNIEPTPQPQAPLVNVERVYLLDWDRFTEIDWLRLDSVYRSLPGGYPVNEQQMWFGSDEADPPYIWASVEPSGLQVCGNLKLSDWIEWDRQFCLRLPEFPIRKLE